MRKNIWLMMIAAVLAAGMMFAAGCSNKSDKGDAGGKALGASQGSTGQRGSGRGGKGGGIKTAKADYKPMTLQREYIGEVAPAYSVDIRSNGSGWLKSLSVDIGRKVARGQELCVVDQEDMRAQKEQSEAQNQQVQAQSLQTQAQNQQAQAGIAVAESAVARAEADLQQSKSDEARTEAMFQKGYVSQSDLENAKTAVKRFQAALDATRAQLAQSKALVAQSNAQLSQSKAQLLLAKAQLKSIQVRLNDLTIRAPFSGVVAEKYVDAGAYVSPSTNIVKIVDDSSVKVVVNATEEDVTRVAVDAAAVVKSDAWPNREFTGKVIRVSPVVDNVSRTGAVEILIPNQSGALRAGMMVRVDLTAAHNPAALAVPAEAVIIDQATGGKFVMVMEGKTPRRHDVQIGIQSGADVEITNGLSAGDSVVVGALPPDAVSGSGDQATPRKPRGKSGAGK